ncbi:MAG: AraC family transcriptional regulator [Pseudomonadota bacterium]
MSVRRFLLANYLDPGDSHHAVIKDISPTRPRFRHDHDYFELMVVLAGPLRHEIGPRAEILGTGAALFLRPRDAHLLHAPRGRTARILNVMVRPEVIADMGQRHAATCRERFFWSQTPQPEALILSSAMQDRITSTADVLRNGPADLLRLEAFLTVFLAELTSEVAAFDANLPPWLATACRTALSPDVFRDGAAGLARISGRSHEHLCRAMRRHMGVTPSAWINGVRMDHAGRLVREGRLATADVAEAVGIGNLGHFYRLFRERHGMTPRAHRLKSARAPV